MLPVLFDRKIEVTQMNLALGEAIAHLNYLVATGRMVREQDERGVNCYQTTDKTVATRAGKSHHKDTAPIEV